ncbi:hypothetical protein LguiA_016067 [Lonicera macranthoides]
MDISRTKSHSNGNQHFKGFENVREDKKFAENDFSDSLFINHAEMAWNERRRAWVGDDKPQRQQRTPRDPIMSWTTTYEDLLLSTEPFQDPIPLAEMVDFLVDTWLEDGLYD